MGMNVIHWTVSTTAPVWPIFVQITILAAVFDRGKKEEIRKSQYF
jgi:hypothetical protein